MFLVPWEHLISKACLPFSNSAIKVVDSQAYTNMELTREHIDFNFDIRETMRSPQTGVRFVRAAVAWAILESAFGLSHYVKQLLQGI